MALSVVISGGTPSLDGMDPTPGGLPGLVSLGTNPRVAQAPT